ncbi:serine/threonine-protein kinase [Chitinibacter sp. GC72]|uniref:serine/threonine-protein kinase n=1 Tax=Chitinibacter sp. GC72 TaxID=1526917 RepID=UPI0012F71D83|nr:serine/threonine-protein kinase [Chitinibacter sp. GC72]
MSQPKIAHYQLQSRLGQGAMGVVFRARDERLERDVALKLVQVNLASNEAADYAARLLQEARSAARLNHPGIITVYDCGQWRNKPYLAMELVQGVTLKDMLEKRGPLSIRQVISIARQMFAALGHAHRHKVIHRDIKPANLMLTREGRLKITDFGIAQMPASDLTRTGTILGSPRYMSPEQLAGKKLDGRADLYSAGVVLYQCLTGNAPFDGETTMNIVYQVLHSNPPPPHELRAEVPRALSELIMRCLARHPEARFAHADEALAALLAGANGPVSEARLANEPTLTLTPEGGAGGSQPDSASPAASAMSPPSAASPVLPWLVQTGSLLAWLWQHGVRLATWLARWCWRTLQAMAALMQRWTPLLWARLQRGWDRGWRWTQPRLRSTALAGKQRFMALPRAAQVVVSLTSLGAVLWLVWPQPDQLQIEFAQTQISVEGEAVEPVKQWIAQGEDLQMEQQERAQTLAKMAADDLNEIAQASAPPQWQEQAPAEAIAQPPGERSSKQKVATRPAQPPAADTPPAPDEEGGLSGIGSHLSKAGEQLGTGVKGVFDCIRGRAVCPTSAPMPEQRGAR